MPLAAGRRGRLAQHHPAVGVDGVLDEADGDRTLAVSGTGSARAGGTATVISLAGRLPGGSSDLPEGRNGPDQPCPLIWPCSRWGLPSQPVTRLLVGSYIKPAAPFHPYLIPPLTAGGPWRYAFCCTFPVLRPPRPKGGGRLRTVGVTHHRVLWSPDFPLPGPPPAPKRRRRLAGNDRPAGLQKVPSSLYETGRGPLAVGLKGSRLGLGVSVWGRASLP